MIRSPLSYRSRPPMMLSSVVLPEPDGPNIATNSLSRRFRLTSSNAFCTKSPVLYCLEIDLICSTMLPLLPMGGSSYVSMICDMTPLYPTRSPSAS